MKMTNIEKKLIKKLFTEIFTTTENVLILFDSLLAHFGKS